MVNIELKDRIKQAITLSGKSQRAVAMAIDVSPQAITKWLKSGLIASNNLVRLADVTGVSPLWLLNGDTSDNKFLTSSNAAERLLNKINKLDSEGKLSPSILSAIEALVDSITEQPKPSGGDNKLHAQLIEDIESGRIPFK